MSLLRKPELYLEVTKCPYRKKCHGLDFPLSFHNYTTDFLRLKISRLHEFAFSLRNFQVFWHLHFALFLQPSVWLLPKGHFNLESNFNFFL